MRCRGGRLLVVLLGVLATLAVAGPAAAHVGGEAAGSDFDGRVVAVTPSVPGLTVRILQFGDELELVNESATEVIVPGYQGEPYLRIGADGVWRNAHSPATYINLDRYARVALPEVADERAEPDWVQVSTEAQYVWHDHRTHWMSEGLLPPRVAAAPDRSHTVSEWAVPLLHGGTPVEVTGVLTWSPPPSPWLVWPVYAALALLAVAAGLLARTARPLGALLLVGAAAALAHALGTPEPPVTVGSHAGALMSALMPALTAVLVAALGFRASRHGRGALTGLLAVVLGWLLLVQGLPDVDVLWSANVLSRGPGVVARLAVLLLLALGVGLVVGGVAAVRRLRETGVPRPGVPAEAGSRRADPRVNPPEGSADLGYLVPRATGQQAVRPRQVGLEVDLDGDEPGDVQRAEADAVPLDGQLHAALEVVLVAAVLQVPDQRGLVSGGDIVDPDGLAQTTDDGLGQLAYEAVLVEGVLDLLLGDGVRVDADEALVRTQERERQLQHRGVEDDVAVEPQHAALA
jgi:hypothetical protein